MIRSIITFAISSHVIFVCCSHQGSNPNILINREHYHKTHFHTKMDAKSFKSKDSCNRFKLYDVKWKHNFNDINYEKCFNLWRSFHKLRVELSKSGPLWTNHGCTRLLFHNVSEVHLKKKTLWPLTKGFLRPCYNYSEQESWGLKFKTLAANSFHELNVHGIPDDL